MVLPKAMHLGKIRGDNWSLYAQYHDALTLNKGVVRSGEWPWEYSLGASLYSQVSLHR